uniref:Uncharacterized protein n=1 Tax=Oryza brachyantha TaxID=4533 RepID=J3N0T3_ORYBR
MTCGPRVGPDKAGRRTTDCRWRGSDDVAVAAWGALVPRRRPPGTRQPPPPPPPARRQPPSSPARGRLLRHRHCRTEREGGSE